MKKLRSADPLKVPAGGNRVSALVLMLVLAVAGTGCTGDMGEALQRANDSLRRAFEPASDASAEVEGSESPDPLAEAAYRAGLEARERGALKQAFDHFLEAATRGHGAAAYEVSRAYAEGRGTERNLDDAADWTNRAAALGEPRAQFIIGSAYYGGIGVEQDYAVAADYLIAAANQGHAQAQYLLGEAYSNGRGVPQDAAWAARWYGKAAAQGIGEAQYAYGVVHATGLGVPKNPLASYTWLTIAARGGHANAKVVKRAVAAQMSTPEIEQAEARAARFVPTRDNGVADAATVSYVQHVLNRRGYDAGPVDGVAGARTRAAIRKFQDAAGIAADGRITPQLLARLRA